MIQDLIAPSTGIPHEQRIAVLVDGENVSQACADIIVQTAMRAGIVAFRRVYGNVQTLKEWETEPRFSAVHTGSAGAKNCADISIVIDAMDIAYAGKATTFVIASSDGDFAPLARRLCEGGFRVIGIGCGRASLKFKEACSTFVALPDPTSQTGVERMAEGKPAKLPVKPFHRNLDKIELAIHDLCRTHGGKEARIHLKDIGQLLPSHHQIRRQDTGRATWRLYLQSKPDLFVVEGKAHEMTVRLKRP